MSATNFDRQTAVGFTIVQLVTSLIKYPAFHRSTQSRPCMRSRGTPPAWLAKVLQLYVSVVLNEFGKNQNIPDCTGVKTGVTLVNSLSKLLVSVALLI